jgi:uncharacterized protein
MLRSLILALFWFLVLAGCATQTPSIASARVLILTGEDNHHRWQETTPVVKAFLEVDPRLQVDVLDDLRKVADTDLSAYSAVIIHFKNDGPAVPGRVAFDHINEYVRNGGGLVLIHFACGAFEEFRDDYEALVGRVWWGLPGPKGKRHHDPYGPFEVKATDANHVITAGLEAFTTTDELYICLIGDTPVQVLATALSPVDSQTYPMALVRTPGVGRVFLSTLGHDVAAYKAKGVQELYRRGTAWAAGLTPPSNEALHSAQRKIPTSGY